MNVLVIDQDRIGLDLVLRASRAGHVVKWFRFLKRPTRDGEGFEGFIVVDRWQDHMQWAKDGLIICMHNGKYIYELDRYREFGFKIFGPTVKSAELEIRRSVGMSAFKAAGIDIPDYHEFTSLSDARKFAMKADQPYVFKTLGDNEDKSLSFVASDPAELVGWIDEKMATGLNLKGPCMLQEKIDMVCEMGVSAWCGPAGFLPDKYQIFFEHKKLMCDELGPNTGEMGTLQSYVDTDRMVEEVLLPLEPIVRTLGHCGDFAVGCGIDSSGKAWPFEPTCRLGWPAFFGQVAAHRGDPVKWMRDLLDGKDTLRVTYDAGLIVLMAQPPFPYDEAEKIVPITGLEDIGDQAHPVSVMKGRGPLMRGDVIVMGDIDQTTGEYVLCVSGFGKTIDRARKKTYEAIDKVKFPDRMYRTDVGLKVADCLSQLHKFGYALTLEA